MFLTISGEPDYHREKETKKDYEILLCLSSGDICIKEPYKDPSIFLHEEEWQKLRKFLNETNKRLVNPDHEDYPKDTIFGDYIKRGE